MQHTIKAKWLIMLEQRIIIICVLQESYIKYGVVDEPYMFNPLLNDSNRIKLRITVYSTYTE